MWKQAVLALLLTCPCLPQPLPSVPKYPPAKVVQPVNDEAPPQSLSHRYQLQAGWNAVSFPFAKTLGCRGFDYGLINASSGYVNTGKRPLELPPGTAYWAYSDKNQEAIAWGQPHIATTTISLQSGWNFVGSPLPVPVDFSQITFGDGREVNRVLEEAALIKPSWLDTKVFSVDKDRFDSVELTTTRSQFVPGRGYWVYAYKPITMRVNDPTEVPVVSRVDRGQIRELVIEGDNFGDPSLGRLVLDAIEIPAADILEWTARRIRFSLPGSLNSQRLAVVAGGAASPRISEKSIGSSSVTPGEGNTVTFTVTSESKEPVPSARVQIGAYPPATTGPNGVAVIQGVAEGPHAVKITAPNFQPRTTKLTVPAGENHRTSAVLYSPRSTISVRATPCTGGWRPYSIDIWQKRNWRTRYYNTFRTDQRTPYVELFWSQCPTNIVYCIEITWRNRQQYEKRLRVERKLNYYGLQETFYNYWGYY